MGGRRSLQIAAADGCYDAARAAALSGVPRSTVYWWARHGVVVPSVSPTREKLWSFSDLMALRIVAWLRHPKPDAHDEKLPASPLPSVRRALGLLQELGLDPWHHHSSGSSPLLVDRTGGIYVLTDDGYINSNRQRVLYPADVLQLTSPFELADRSGPDLFVPRPNLRIVPARVNGEPHIVNTRVTSVTIAALAARGYTDDEISSMYQIPSSGIRDAIDLEAQLAGMAAAA